MRRAGVKTPSLSRAVVESIILLSLVFVRAHAEILPVKTFTTADGLLRDEANRIKQDSRGFLWFCTNDGLSRFDGYDFINYTTDDGLPHRVVNDLLETRAGVIWIATNDGLARFNPKGKRGLARNGNQANPDREAAEPMFVTYWPEENLSRHIGVLFEDAQGKLWCGTDDGLSWFEDHGGKGVFHRVDLPKDKPNYPLPVSAIIQARRGSLWIGMEQQQGLNRILPDGRVEHYSTKHEHNESESITTLLETKEGEIWAGMSRNGGLCSLVSEPDPRRALFSRCYAKKDGLPVNWISALYQTADGKLWIGTTDGTASFHPNAGDSPQFRVYREAQGFCAEATLSFREDREGNLWAATACGVKKIVRGGFVRYAEGDGLAQPGVNSIFVSHTGELFVITSRKVESKQGKSLRVLHVIHRFDGKRFNSVTPHIPANVSTGWGSGQVAVEDRAGQWWFPSDQKAAFRFPRVDALAQLSSVEPHKIPIPDEEVFRLYEDLRGNIWIGTMYNGRVLKWERNTALLRDYTEEIPKPADVPARVYQMASFAEDPQGTLWVGFYNHGYLMRYRDGRFALLPTHAEKSGDAITSLYFDRAGRLWLSSTLNGVGRIDAPDADQLKVVWYNRRNGLATDGILDLTEDKLGRIYAGHARGVDRLDPNTGQIKHYTAADGLPQGAIHHLARDAQGGLWFGGHGLARLVPEPDMPRQAPTILLTGLRVAGVKQYVSELGEETLRALTLDSTQTQVSVDYLGLGAGLGEELKYQYRLEGAQADWSEPTAQRTVDFPNLAPGSYRFLVMAVDAEGTKSITSATFSFTILRPIWQRWWFVFLLAATLILVLYAILRYRLVRLLELERIRTRIASDLHDDIGAHLSLIAMASEVVRLQSPQDNAQTREPLAMIAETSRELVDAMGDIVWAINPSKDHLRDLTKKMRRFASDVFAARNIAFQFHAPSDEHDMKLEVDTRREIFLIFKEGVNNIAKHSECTEANINLSIDARSLLLRLSDNGKGFDSSKPSDGNGLASMRQRTGRLGGTIEIASNDGAGTTVELRVPLRRRRSRWRPRN